MLIKSENYISMTLRVSFRNSGLVSSSVSHLRNVPPTILSHTLRINRRTSNYPDHYHHHRHKCKRSYQTSSLHATITSLATVPSPSGSDGGSRLLGNDPAWEIDEGGEGIYFWGRKWNWFDLSDALLVGTPHFLTLFAPFTFSWAALKVSVVLGLMTGFGLTFSYHRNLSHRSFKLPKWLEYFFAYCGVHALEKDPIFWVSAHRYHHKYADTERDPHSPIINGVWFGHMGWLFDSQKFADKCGEPRPREYSNVKDLKKQRFYRFMNQTYYAHPLALAVLLYAIGGFPFVVWGVGVRATWVYQSTFITTSIFHMWGKQDWNSNDHSKNNWLFAITNLGEGFHNTHHAFPYSARVGLEWWQIDLTWYLIRFLELIGLATNVKLPTEKDKKRMSFPDAYPAGESHEAKLKTLVPAQ